MLFSSFISFLKINSLFLIFYLQNKEDNIKIVHKVFRELIVFLHFYNFGGFYVTVAKE